MTRPTLLVALAAALVLAVMLFLPVTRQSAPPTDAAAARPAPATAPMPAAATPPAAAAPADPVPESAPLGGESDLAADLNAPSGTIQRDLAILQDVFSAWLTNFPRLGHPGGENRDITAALCGENPVRFAFVPRTHRAINAAGELCDRWGTPFRFHQLSGQHMELRSAGPDRRFGTADDAVLTPAGAPVL